MGKKSSKPEAAPTSTLSDREEAFCQYYFVYLNRARAAHKAGWGSSVRTARYAARDLWKRDDIQARLSELREEWKEKIGITLERVMKERASIAFSDPALVAEWTADSMSLKSSKKLPRRIRAAIREISFEYWRGGGRTTFRLHDKDPSLAAIERVLGIAQKVEHTGKDGKELGNTTVILNIPDNGRRAKN